MLQFIKTQPEVVPKLLLHMSTSAIMDLLLKIISMEEAQEGKGTVQVWLLCDLLTVSPPTPVAHTQHCSHPLHGILVAERGRTDAMACQQVGPQL